jgi:hypothetical protein
VLLQEKSRECARVASRKAPLWTLYRIRCTTTSKEESTFKGGKYLVLSVAEDSTNGREGTKVVVYVSLTYGEIHTRDLSEFTQEVEWPNGQKGPRFVIAK